MASAAATASPHKQMGSPTTAAAAERVNVQLQQPGAFTAPPRACERSGDFAIARSVWYSHLFRATAEQLREIREKFRYVQWRRSSQQAVIGIYVRMLLLLYAFHAHYSSLSVQFVALYIYIDALLLSF